MRYSRTFEKPTKLDSLSSEDILRLRLETSVQSQSKNETKQIGDINDFYHLTNSISVNHALSLESFKENLESKFPVLDESNLKVKDLPTKKVHEVWAKIFVQVFFSNFSIFNPEKSLKNGKFSGRHSS